MRRLKIREMKHVRSNDGTTIAFDQVGSGPAVILVGGAFSYRAFPKMVELAELLGDRFTVINYDRRGRGDSNDIPPYAVAREIDDLDALVREAGGKAAVWGWSSGGVLALRAAARGLGITKLALYDPPFIVDPSHRMPPRDFALRLERMVRSGKASGATRYFMREGMGVPAPIVAVMRLLPLWSKLKAVAHTLPYDWAVLGNTMSGAPLSPEEWASIKVPTLVIAGEKSGAQLRQAAEALAEVLPEAELRDLPRQGHNVSMPALAPMLVKFFAEDTAAPTSR
jgi:pimeloyl-ACP methyl ester carboxylesterase